MSMLRQLYQIKYAILFSEKLAEAARTYGNVFPELQPPLLARGNLYDACF